MQTGYPTPPASPISQASFAFEDTGCHDRIGQIINNRLQLVDELGIGAYGVVYRAVDIRDPTGRQYAVKALRKQGLEPRQQMFQELEIQLHQEASRSGHRNIVQLVGIVDDEDYKYVILEYCPEGDLFSNITDRRRYVRNDPVAKQVFLQIIDAVMHCHSLEIYHRDLKPENILVTEDGGCVKLADFGLATKDRLTSDFGCGSTFYMSPECQTSSPRPFASYASAPNDVWSLGVILVNLTCGRNPWKRACLDDSTYLAFTKDRSFLKSILPITDDLSQILSMIFEPDPSLRITLPVLRQMIVECPKFTLPPQSILSVPSQPLSPPTQFDSVRPIVRIDAPPSPELQPYDPPQPQQFTSYPSPPATPPLTATPSPPWTSNTIATPISTFTSGCTDSGSAFANAASQPAVLPQQAFTIVPPVPTKVVAYQQSPQYVPTPGYYYWIPQHISRMACYFQQPFQQHLHHMAQVAC